jgi:hypothetical protein
MKKTFLTLILPIVIILIGIGLVIGSFHPQTRTFATHAAPVVAQSASSASSSAPNTDSSTGEKQKTQHQGTGKVEASTSQPTSPASSSSRNKSNSSVLKTSSSSASGTATSHTHTAASTGSTVPVQASGKRASNAATTHESHASAAASQSGASSASSDASSKQSSVSVSIRGLNGFSASGSAAYHSGDSVFSELQQFTQAKGIQFSYSGFGSSIYISSINNQKAGQTSPSSGWMYTVNGKQPKISAGAYRTKPGDKIIWNYTK